MEEFVYVVYYPSYYFEVDSIWTEEEEACDRAKDIGYNVFKWRLNVIDGEKEIVGEFFDWIIK